jgi:hypothetical protein
MFDAPLNLSNGIEDFFFNFKICDEMQIQSMFPNSHLKKKVWEFHDEIKMSLLS